MAIHNLDILIALWVCSILTLIVLLTRIFLRIIKKRQAMKDDYWIIFSVFLLIGRCLVMHWALLYGSNNVKSTVGLTEEEIMRRSTGSKLTLSARVFYGGFVWVMKLCMLYFYQRLTSRLVGFKTVIFGVKIILAMTLMGVVVSTFVECRPFNLYWQVVPAPPKACRQAQAQLLTMGITNIITDLMILAIPIPVIWTSQLPLRRKIQLLTLFAIGIFVIIITIMKMPIIVKNANIIRQRALWASLEMLACCIVVNAPVLIAYVKTKKRDTNMQYLSGSRSRSVSTGVSRRLAQQSMDVTIIDGKDHIIIKTSQDISQTIDARNDLEKGKNQEQINMQNLKRSDTVITDIWTDRGAASGAPSNSTTSLSAQGRQ